MAYVNVKDWSVDQVTDWLKGLDSVILQYNTSFLNNGVSGHQLLNLRADDLEHLGVKILGHQEIILEAVEHLRNFHYELDKENLQTLALRISCAANSLFKELLLADDDSQIGTQVMSDIHNIISAIKPIVYWLDRSPFTSDKDYIDCKTNLLQLSFEMATSAHRGIFSEKPVYTIRNNCERLSKIADFIIEDLMDPMILQPASLDLATLKKKEQELGFFILPHNQAVHQIADIKHGSPAHACSKIEEGDEIVQVNYQTVVGWQRKKVLLLLQESPPEIVLTLKKRPHHTKVYGQIYMKPYRLPSRKRSNQSWSTRWNDNIPSPRLLPILDLPPIIISKSGEENEPPDLETEQSSSDSEPPDSPLDFSGRMYPLKPRPVLKRRNTITGATPISKRPYPSIEQYWDLFKSFSNTPYAASTCNITIGKFEEESQCIRDKSASCNLGLDLAPRPTTVIGLQSKTPVKKTFNDSNNTKKVNFQEEIKAKETIQTPNLNEEKSISVNSLQSLNNVDISFIDEGRDLTDRTSMISTWQKQIITEIIDAIHTKPPQNQLIQKPENVLKRDPILADINVYSIVKKFDVQAQENTQKSIKTVLPQKAPPVTQKTDAKVKPAVPPRSATTKLRGRLDKSHSTPAYDLSEEPEMCDGPVSLTLKSDNGNESEKGTPCDNNKAVLEVVNPIIVPTITKQKEEARIVEVPLFWHLHPNSISTPVTKIKMESEDIRCDKAVPVYALQKTNNDTKGSPTQSIVKNMLSKGKSSSKKKNYIAAKRRRVGANELSSADFQGYLYQRLRGKHNQNVLWKKRWFVLMGSYLYGFTTKEDSKAVCLIFLSGFTVAVACEVKSKLNAFKVYHTGTVFYFSAEDSDTLQQWIDHIKSGCLQNDTVKPSNTSLYSETDDSDSEKSQEKTDSLKKFGSLNKNSSKKSLEQSHSGSTSLDRKWFFNKSRGSNKTSVPMPTAQFRSYRKMRDPQSQSHSITTGNFTSHILFFSSQNLRQLQNTSVPNLAVETLRSDQNEHQKSKLDYVHASNPNLCSTAVKTTSSITWNWSKPQENLIEFVTLEELMKKQSEEQKLNPHHIIEATKNLHSIESDLDYGEMPMYRKIANEKQHRNTKSKSEKHDLRSSCFGKRLGSLKKNSNKIEDFEKTATYPKAIKGDKEKKYRSLPRAHKVQDSPDIDGNTEPSKHISNEMVYCPKTENDVHYATNRTLDDMMLRQTKSTKSCKIKKQSSFSASEKMSKSSGNGESITKC